MSNDGEFDLMTTRIVLEGEQLGFSISLSVKSFSPQFSFDVAFVKFMVCRLAASLALTERRKR